MKKLILILFLGASLSGCLYHDGWYTPAPYDDDAEDYETHDYDHHHHGHHGGHYGDHHHGHH